MSIAEATGAARAGFECVRARRGACRGVM